MLKMLTVRIFGGNVAGDNEHLHWGAVETLRGLFGLVCQLFKVHMLRSAQRESFMI